MRSFNLLSFGTYVGYGRWGFTFFGFPTKRQIQKAIFGYWIMNDADKPKEHILEIFFVRFILH